MEQTADQSATVTSNPVRGAEHLHPDDLRRLLREGWRCVRYEFCVSAIIATFRFQTATYLTDSWQTRYLHGLGWGLISLAFGPWGVPWGPILTARAIWADLRGGVDMTAQVLSRLDAGELGWPSEPGGSGR